MNSRFFLFLSIIFFESILSLDIREKDKYLACQLIYDAKIQKDKDIIEVKLTQDGFLRKGIERLMSLNTIKLCVGEIKDEITNKYYKDLLQLRKDVQEEDFSLVKIDYDEYGKKEEFIFDEEEREIMQILRQVKIEADAKAAEISKDL